MNLNLQNWMKDLSETIKEKRVTEISLPGTHDSAAYRFNGNYMPNKLGGVHIGFLEFLRKSSLDFGCDSIDITGEILRKDTLVPFSFIATKTKHVNELKAALEINLSQAFPFLEEVFPSNKPLLIKAFIKKDIRLNKDRLTVSLLFVDYGTLLLQSNGDGDFIEFVLPRKQRSLSDFKLSVSRKHGQNKFSGDWNGTLVSKDLIKRFPIFDEHKLRINMNCFFRTNL